MLEMSKARRWTPYVCGALTGLLAIGSAVATTRVMGTTTFLGTSTTFVRASAMVERSVFPEHVAKNEYFKKEKIKVDWQAMLVCGLFFGALAGALTGRAFEWEGVPPTWRKRFGPSVTKRAAGGFLGGVVAMFGARLAGGCPSGQGLSGMMQLSVSGLVATACFFWGGILAAKYLARKGR